MYETPGPWPPCRRPWPELLSRDGVICTIVLLMTQMLYYYYSWAKKTTTKIAQLYFW